MRTILIATTLLLGACVAAEPHAPPRPGLSHRAWECDCESDAGADEDAGCDCEATAQRCDSTPPAR
jgi:hypothetical protein